MVGNLNVKKLADFIYLTCFRDILDEIPKPNIAESSAPAEKENVKPKSKPKSKKEVSL